MTEQRSCRSCSCYARGQQDAAFDTYAPNLAATAAREQAELERSNAVRWHE